MTSSALGITVARAGGEPRGDRRGAAQQAGAASRALGPLSVCSGRRRCRRRAASVVVADGQLADALAPPHWTFAGFDGSFAVFANQLARPTLSIEALAGPVGRGRVDNRRRRCAGRADGGHGVLPRRRPRRPLGGDIPGWSATWQPRHGPAVALAVQRDGLVQAVDVPAGLGVITWSYTPPLFPAGLALSLAATGVLLALLAFPALLALLAFPALLAFRPCWPSRPGPAGPGELISRRRPSRR